VISVPQAAAQAAALGRLVQIAYRMFEADRASLAPTPDPGLATAGWELIGHLTAADSLFRSKQTMVGGGQVWYGFLARSTTVPGDHVAVIRGTEGIVEWVKDAQFLMTPHPSGGRVEHGFQDIYGTLQLTPGAGVTAPAHIGIQLALGDAGTMTIVAHSLGASLGTLLRWDLATIIGERVKSCLFASPRPGDAVFAKSFDALPGSYTLYNYELDIVPRVPTGFAYTDLPRVSWIGIAAAQAHIRFDFLCHHHIECYRAMLDYAADDWSAVPCILGPTPAANAGGLAL
jgi:triacylglycerol lipase